MRSSARREVLVGRGQIRRVLPEDRRHRVRRGVAVEGAAPSEHLVEDRAEGEDVAARVGRLAADLLGRHVGESPHDDAGLRAGGCGREVAALALLFGVRQLREAEVQDLHPAVVGDEDVLGLQVPVDDPLLVRGAEAVDDLERIVDRAARGELASGDDGPQRLPFEQLLDDIGRAVVRPDVVDRRDVRVVQEPCGLRLLLEAAQTIGVGGERRRQDLDRDVAPEARVPARGRPRPSPRRRSRRRSRTDRVGSRVTAASQRVTALAWWARETTSGAWRRSRGRG